MPAATPPEIADKLAQTLTQAEASPQARDFFQNSATQAWTTSGADLAAFQDSELAKWGKVIRAAGIQPE